MSLSLAIPVRNDLQGLRALMERVVLLNCVDEILIFDDGSEVPIKFDDIRSIGGPLQELVKIFRSERSVGAGRGRNILCEYLNTSHVLFFDSDDLPTFELPRLIRELNGRQFDFCLFKHADTRTASWGEWGQMPIDETLWDMAGITETAPKGVSLHTSAILAETANYPWNKIYRVDFLRDNKAVRCFEIPVHNDVGLHWNSFLEAQTILVSSRIAAQHYVADGKGRLTNRTGIERLEIFPPLGQLADQIFSKPSKLLILPFLWFVTGLFKWIRHNLDPTIFSILNDKIFNFFKSHIPPEAFAQISQEDPVLGQRICLILQEASM